MGCGAISGLGRPLAGEAARGALAECVLFRLVGAIPGAFGGKRGRAPYEAGEKGRGLGGGLRLGERDELFQKFFFLKLRLAPYQPQDWPRGWYGLYHVATSHIPPHMAPTRRGGGSDRGLVQLGPTVHAPREWLFEPWEGRSCHAPSGPAHLGRAASHPPRSSPASHKAHAAMQQRFFALGSCNRPRAVPCSLRRRGLRPMHAPGRVRSFTS